MSVIYVVIGLEANNIGGMRSASLLSDIIQVVIIVGHELIKLLSFPARVIMITARVTRANTGENV